MKGGGVKGLAFAGAVRELQSYFQFEAFVGTSAGAIAATLFAAGATGAMLEETLRRKRFRDFLDGKIWTAPFNIWFFGGIHPGVVFSNWLRSELHRLIRTQSELLMKDLPTRAVVYASTPEYGAVIFDSKGGHADSSVHSAVRCSMSIPYFFQPQTVDGRRVYDGGLLNNYPVQIFLEQKRPGMLNGASNFIALYLGSEQPPLLKRRFVFADLMSVWLDRNDPKIIDQYRSQTIIIDTTPIGTIDFDLTDQEKDFLVLIGRSAALEFIATRGLLNQSKIPVVTTLRAEAERLRAAIIDARRKRRRPLRMLFYALGAVIALYVLLVSFPQHKPVICAFSRSCATEPFESLEDLSRYLERP
jgi:predicted acylesterase/phospholipase RssA